MLVLDGTSLDLRTFCYALDGEVRLDVRGEVLQKIADERLIVDRLADGDKPVYGLNTGLGANLEFRLSPEEIPEFQMQLLRGRAVACGSPLPAKIGKAAVLARIISATGGHSGISVELYEHLCSYFNSGLAPAIPEYGSIGAGDLTQNAHMALSVLGEGEVWDGGHIKPGKEALHSHSLTPPELKPKDAMVLVNHSGLSVARAAIGLQQAWIALNMLKAAAVLSLEGYCANTQVFGVTENTLRAAPGQEESAAWFAKALEGSEQNPRRIQEALSFRTLAPVMGAAEHTLKEATKIWQNELNGSSDSPAIVEGGEMRSTANFHSPALALALESVANAFAMAANGSVQRMQRMMNPDLSGLPRYLTPLGGGSAGMVPTQKTAAALLADIRHKALPITIEAAPVSDGVEDMAPMTAQAGAKLEEQTVPIKLLAGLEAMVACQALDLRQPSTCGRLVTRLRPKLREAAPMLEEDRALGADINRIALCLEENAGQFSGE